MEKGLPVFQDYWCHSSIKQWEDGVNVFNLLLRQSYVFTISFPVQCVAQVCTTGFIFPHLLHIVRLHGKGVLLISPAAQPWPLFCSGPRGGGGFPRFQFPWPTPQHGLWYFYNHPLIHTLQENKLICNKTITTRFLCPFLITLWVMRNYNLPQVWHFWPSAQSWRFLERMHICVINVRNLALIALALMFLTFLILHGQTQNGTEWKRLNARQHLISPVWAACAPQ